MYQRKRITSAAEHQIPVEQFLSCENTAILTLVFWGEVYFPLRRVR